MGWKNIKEQFGIRHHIEVTQEGICIGSGYVSKLVTIDPQTGAIHENPTFSGFLRKYYPNLLEAAPEDIVKLIAAPDTFSASIPVYTYENADIIEKRCETPGWPNATHDGCMMYENMYSTNKEQVVAWAKNSVACQIEWTQKDIEQREQELAERRARLAQSKVAQAKLEADYPSAIMVQ